MIIFGVDPGTCVTGYGVLEFFDGSFRVLDFGCIKTPQSLKLTDRYLIIFDCLQQLLEKFNPDVLVVETQFVHKNSQSAIKLGMARGIVLLAAKKRGMQIMEYSPTRAKKAVTGRGHATKYQVQAMVKQLLDLEEIPEPEDAADALALAICHANSVRFDWMSGVEI